MSELNFELVHVESKLSQNYINIIHVHVLACDLLCSERYVLINLYILYGIPVCLELSMN